MNFKIEVIKELPTLRRKRASEYDIIIEQFLKSNQRYSKISMKGKSPRTLLYGLKNILKIKSENKSEKKPVRIHFIQGEVFLENTAATVAEEL